MSFMDLRTNILYLCVQHQLNGFGTRDGERLLYGKRKFKAVPLQAWSGPESSRKLRFPDFMTTTQDDCKVVSLTHRPPLPPGNTPDTHLC
jgi:hypothetical protein